MHLDSSEAGEAATLYRRRVFLLQKEHYLRVFIANREVPAEDRLREVYLDESYIHEHYHRNDDSLRDSNDDQDIQYSKAPAKGRRYCFAAAIQGPDPRVVQHDGLDKERKAGLVPNSLWVFCPQSRGANTGDYHKVFDGENFVNWWKTQLLPNLHQPSMIMMDTASYHKVTSAAPKLGKMKKQEIKEWLQGEGVPIQDNMTALALRECARKYIKESIPMDCVNAAEEMGHKVLFTPPYHSDLQPIELVWALVKGNVLRQFNKNTTMKLVYERLIAESHKLEQDGHQLIERWWTSAPPWQRRCVTRFWRQMTMATYLLMKRMKRKVFQIMPKLLRRFRVMRKQYMYVGQVKYNHFSVIESCLDPGYYVYFQRVYRLVRAARKVQLQGALF